MLKAVETRAIRYLWTNAFQRKLQQAVENMDLFNDRWFVGAYVYAGTKSILELGHEITGLTIDEAKEQTEGRQSIMQLIFSTMATLTPRQFEQLFPIIKEYNGNKWQCKDYFYTRDYLRKLNMDEPIGADRLQDFLWEYHNNLVREFLVYSLGIVDDFLKLQGEPTIGEQWATDNNIPLYYEHTDPVTNQSYLQESTTGKVTPITKTPVLKTVK